MSHMTQRRTIWSIYALVDPRTNLIRYIGCSVNPEARLISHRSEKYNKAKLRWLLELKTAGLAPVVKIIQTAKNLKDAYTFEKSWIMLFSVAVHDQLLNKQFRSDFIPVGCFEKSARDFRLGRSEFQADPCYLQANAPKWRRKLARLFGRLTPLHGGAYVGTK